MPAPARDQPPTLLDDVRQGLRLHHYSLHTERSSVEWIVGSSVYGFALPWRHRATDKKCKADIGVARVATLEIAALGLTATMFLSTKPQPRQARLRFRGATNTTSAPASLAI